MIEAACDESHRFSFAVMPLPAVTIVMFVIDRGSHKPFGQQHVQVRRIGVRQNNTRSISETTSEFLLCLVLGGSSIAVCIPESVPRLEPILLWCKPRLGWITNTGEQEYRQNPDRRNGKVQLQSVQDSPLRRQNGYDNQEKKDGQVKSPIHEGIS